MEKLISVIVPIFNVEHYLEECIQSILNQTYHDLEIILVNDGSTDRSLEICRNYQKEDCRIILLDKDNGGLSSARNAGLEIATGKYIAFVDSDDTIESSMFEEMYMQFVEYPDTDVVVCGFKRYDDKTGNVYSQEMINCNWNIINEGNKQEYMYMNPGVWNKMYKAEMFNDIKFEEVHLAEDLLLFLDLLPEMLHVRRVPKVLYNYRVRDNSIINSVTQEQYNELIDQLAKRRKKIEKSVIWDLNLYDAIVFLHIGISITFRLIEGNRINSKLYIKSTKQILDNTFSTWRGTPYIGIQSGMKNGIKGIGVWGCRLLYKWNLFILFIKFYEFIQKKLKLDIKW